MSVQWTGEFEHVIVARGTTSRQSHIYQFDWRVDSATENFESKSSIRYQRRKDNSIRVYPALLTINQIREQGFLLATEPSYRVSFTESSTLDDAYIKAPALAAIITLSEFKSFHYSFLPRNAYDEEPVNSWQLRLYQSAGRMQIATAMDILFSDDVTAHFARSSSVSAIESVVNDPAFGSWA